MGSVDDRIKLFAEEREAEEAADAKKWLRVLRHEVESDVYNIVSRFGSRKKPEERAPWLRNKNYDDTYRDYGPKSKHSRTKVRMEYFIRLCRGDRKLFLEEYARALNKYFPIPGKRFEWGPRLIVNNDRVTVLYKYKLRPKSE
jgi:hypothetical protein